MPISSDDRDIWLARLDADPDGTVQALAALVEAEASRMEPGQIFRIGQQAFNRAQLQAVIVQMRIPTKGYGQREIARQYITDAAIISAQDTD